MTRAYTVKRADRCNDPTKSVKPGDTVYGLAYHDYGLANDDSRRYGVEYTSVTLDPTGNYPGFTIPVDDLDPIPDMEAGDAQ